MRLATLINGVLRIHVGPTAHPVVGFGFAGREGSDVGHLLKSRSH